MMMTMKLTEVTKFFVPSFVSLLSGSSNNLLYFVKVTEKRAASENHPDPYGHFKIFKRV